MADRVWPSSVLAREGDLLMIEVRSSFSVRRSAEAVRSSLLAKGVGVSCSEALGLTLVDACKLARRASSLLMTRELERSSGSSLTARANLFCETASFALDSKFCSVFTGIYSCPGLSASRTGSARTMHRSMRLRQMFSVLRRSWRSVTPGKALCLLKLWVHVASDRASETVTANALPTAGARLPLLF